VLLFVWHFGWYYLERERNNLHLLQLCVTVPVRSRANSPTNKNTFVAPSFDLFLNWKREKYAALCTKQEK
jgi:hypothetical protein